MYNIVLNIMMKKGTSTQLILIHQQLIKKVKKREIYLNFIIQSRYNLNEEFTREIRKNQNIKAKKIRYNHYAKIIQKAWKIYLTKRYQYLGLVNLDDCDPTSLAEIRLIPKIDLYIWFDQNQRPRGGNIFEFLKWISRSSYLEIPIHYTNEKLKACEIEWLIKHSRYIINIKIFSKNYQENKQIREEWIKCVDLIENTHLDRINPMRVHSRLINQRDRLMGKIVTLHNKWTYLITINDLERYLNLLVEKPYQTIPNDLQKIIQVFPLKVLNEFQELWIKLENIKKEKKTFENIFFQ